MEKEKRPSRNAVCPCGSGKKYKLCCLPKAAAPLPKTAAPRPPGEPSEMVTLKAEAYDCMAQIEHWQRRLGQVNQQIATLAGQQQTDVRS